VKLNLYPHLGEDDIVIGGLSEIIEHGYRLNKATRSALMTPLGLTFYLTQRMRNHSNASAVNYSVKSYYQHISESSEPEHALARDVKAAFPGEFGSYYKFAFVRNPYTQVVSEYLWRSKTARKKVSFSTYLDLVFSQKAGNFFNGAGFRNFDIISIDGNLICDYVGKFENFGSDFSAVTKRLGIECELKESAKVGQVSQVEYGSMYKPGDREKVKALFLRELEVFGYDWPF